MVALSAPGGALSSPKVAERLAGALAAVAALDPGDTFDPAVPVALVASRLHLLCLLATRGGLGGGMQAAVGVLSALGAVDGSTALGFAMHTHVIGALGDSEAWPAELRGWLERLVVNDRALLNAASTEEGSGSPRRCRLARRNHRKAGCLRRLSVQGRLRWIRSVLGVSPGRGVRSAIGGIGRLRLARRSAGIHIVNSGGLRSSFRIRLGFIGMNASAGAGVVVWHRDPPARLGPRRNPPPISGATPVASAAVYVGRPGCRSVRCSGDDPKVEARLVAAT